MVDSVNGNVSPQLPPKKGSEAAAQDVGNTQETSGAVEAASDEAGAKENTPQTVLLGAVQRVQSSNTTQSKIQLLEAQARSKKVSAQTANAEDAKKIRREAEDLDKQVKALKSKQGVNKKA